MPPRLRPEWFPLTQLLHRQDRKLGDQYCLGPKATCANLKRIWCLFFSVFFFLFFFQHFFSLSVFIEQTAFLGPVMSSRLQQAWAERSRARGRGAVGWALWPYRCLSWGEHKPDTLS